MRKGVLGVVAVLLTVVACAPPPPPPTLDAVTGAPSVRHPIVITHGWQFFCGSEDADTWKTWIDAAQARGYADDEVAVYSYDTCGSNADAIKGFGELVDRVRKETGSDQVNVIAHSMGSLVARACIRFGSCAGKVDKFLSMAGANHGTVWANFCELAFWSKSTCDMKPDGPFLAKLNADDETWGDVDYTTMISWCDLTIVPFTSAHLDGALNIVTDRCLTHTDWRDDTTAAEWTLDWFDGHPPDRS
jgi:triacylglycerol lipase